jgi:hypothetical protein
MHECISLMHIYINACRGNVRAFTSTSNPPHVFEHSYSHFFQCHAQIVLFIPVKKNIHISDEKAHAETSLPQAYIYTQVYTQIPKHTSIHKYTYTCINTHTHEAYLYTTATIDLDSSTNLSQGIPVCLPVLSYSFSRSSLTLASCIPSRNA